ncbi:hypothetical protein Leryth_025443 [Lithospermum erythrorhizon]|nr:hypothetical protein Leryth_025443 [Lithospermum erythrorhizon]
MANGVKAFSCCIIQPLNSPHPLEILSDRSAYGSSVNIYGDHDMKSYLKCIRNVIRQELNHIRQARKERKLALRSCPLRIGPRVPRGLLIFQQRSYKEYAQSLLVILAIS